MAGFCRRCRALRADRLTSPPARAVATQVPEMTGLLLADTLCSPPHGARQFIFTGDRWLLAAANCCQQDHRSGSPCRRTAPAIKCRAWPPTPGCFTIEHAGADSIDVEADYEGGQRGPATLLEFHVRAINCIRCPLAPRDQGRIAIRRPAAGRCCRRRRRKRVIGCRLLLKGGRSAFGTSRCRVYALRISLMRRSRARIAALACSAENCSQPRYAGRPFSPR